LSDEDNDRVIRGIYKAAMSLNSIVLSKGANGYLVLVGPHQDPGFLPTDFELEIGSHIPSQFVCINGGKVLVSARFQTMNGKMQPVE
jgi:hypothetical protein